MFDDIDENTSAADISTAISTELFAPEAPSGRELSTIDNNSSEIQASPDEGQESTEVAEVTKTQAPGYQMKPLHKAWKKDMEPVWAKSDPALQEYVYKREEDVMRGLQQYQEGHTRWNEVIQPFRHVMQEHPDVNPVELLQNLMTNHLQVLSSPKAQKVALVRDIVRGYGLDLTDFIPQNGEIPAALPPEVGQLRQELSQVRNHLAAKQRAEYEAGVAEQTKLVNTFFSDAKNKYAAEVEADILDLLQKGAANSLQDAYDLACYKNPTVRVKVLADQRAALTGEVKPNVTNLDSSSDVKPRKGKNTSSWQSGVDEIVHKHFGN
jgi:hypothetical protein